MKFSFLVLISILLASCSTEVPNSAVKQISTHVQSPMATTKSSNTQASSVSQISELFGEWVYEKIPESKGVTSDDQVSTRKMLGDTKLTLTKDDYTIFMMGTLDTGTWKSLDGDTYELKSASGKVQKVDLEKINDNQLLFIFLGDKEIQMKKFVE